MCLQMLSFTGCEAHEICPFDYCLNNGICVDMWTYKYCECAPGFLGEQCDTQIMAHFQQNSFLHYSSATTAVINALSFEFTANSSIGVLFYTVSELLSLVFHESEQFRTLQKLHLWVSGLASVAKITFWQQFFPVLYSWLRIQFVPSLRNHHFVSMSWQLVGMWFPGFPSTKTVMTGSWSTLPLPAISFLFKVCSHIAQIPGQICRKDQQTMSKLVLIRKREKIYPLNSFPSSSLNHRSQCIQLWHEIRLGFDFNTTANLPGCHPFWPCSKRVEEQNHSTANCTEVRVWCRTPKTL